MKSPVPFLKPKSYYSPPSRTLVIKDEIITQHDPILQPRVVENIPQDAPAEIKQHVGVEGEQSKFKKPKLKKSSRGV
jgi:hypothetical protein